MCNEAYRRAQIDEIAQDWAQMRIPLRFPEGIPNLAPDEAFRITDRVAIIRGAAGGADGAELVMRRWSWPAPNGRPVFNYRADGRAIAASSRCLIPVDGFFEFTAPPPVSRDAPKPSTRAPKSKWAFTLATGERFAIAGIRRDDGAGGEAFAMLTCPPGADVAPYHDRQVVVLDHEDYGRWLDPAVPAAELCRPSPRGTLIATQVR